jgi:hypothetical protein
MTYWHNVKMTLYLIYTLPILRDVLIILAYWKEKNNAK